MVVFKTTSITMADLVHGEIYSKFVDEMLGEYEDLHYGGVQMVRGNRITPEVIQESNELGIDADRYGDENRSP